MADRYTSIKMYDQEQWIEGCPVLLKKYRLMLDNKEDRNILQLQFVNLSHDIISFMKIRCTALSASKEEVLETIEHNFLDLSVVKGSEFGDRTPIVLSNKDARWFQFEVLEIGFSSELVRGNFKLTNVNAKQSLSIMKFNEQFRREYEAKSEPKYIPEFKENHWICTCGQLNIINECVNCGIHKSRLQTISDLDHLRQENAKWEEKQKEEKARIERIREEKTANRKKTAKYTVIGLVSSLVFISILLVIWYFVIPQIKLNSAKKDYENALTGDLIEAADSVNQYVDLLDDEDEQTDVINTYISKLESAGEYEYVIDYCKTNANVNNSDEETKTILLSCMYNFACECIDNEDVSKAKPLIDKLDYEDYPDADELALVCDAMELRNSEKYSAAIKELSQIDNPIAKSKYKKYSIEYGLNLIGTLKTVPEGLVYLSRVNKSDEVCEEIKKIAQQYAQDNDYSTASEIISEIIEYSDSKDLYKEYSELDEKYQVYEKGIEFLEVGAFSDAMECFTTAQSSGIDAQKQIEFCKSVIEYEGLWKKIETKVDDSKWIKGTKWATLRLYADKNLNLWINVAAEKEDNISGEVTLDGDEIIWQVKDDTKSNRVITHVFDTTTGIDQYKKSGYTYYDKYQIWK